MSESDRQLHQPYATDSNVRRRDDGDGVEATASTLGLCGARRVHSLVKGASNSTHPALAWFVCGGRGAGC